MEHDAIFVLQLTVLLVINCVPNETALAACAVPMLKLYVEGVWSA